jgi:thiamine-phosphate diphosphorylase
LIQLRAKRLASGAFLELADRVAVRAREAGAILVINDRADIARMCEAGVHVGQRDLPASAARALVGPDALVGLSTHNATQAEAGCLEPVTYLAIGPVFLTHTKTGDTNPVVGLAGVRQAADIARARGLPVVAIGGITLDRAASVLEAGASSIAVISDLLAADSAERVKAFLETVGS